MCCNLNYKLYIYYFNVNLTYPINLDTFVEKERTHIYKDRITFLHARVQLDDHTLFIYCENKLCLNSLNQH